MRKVNKISKQWSSLAYWNKRLVIGLALTVFFTLISLFYVRLLYCKNRFDLYFYQALSQCTASLTSLSIKYLAFFALVSFVVIMVYDLIMKSIKK